MSVYPLYLVLGKDGIIGAYARQDILKISLAQNAQKGEPARAVYILIPDSITLSYQRIHDYDELTVPLENLCQRHLYAALTPEFQTSRDCPECK